MNKQVIYFGVVESRDDPLMLGRMKVRIVGIHSPDKSVLPTDDLPWAFPIQPITSAGVSGIGHAPVGVVEGSWVSLQFIDQDQQMPVVTGTVGGIPQADKSQDTEPVTNTLTDGSGNQVLDGSGNPVQVGEPVPPPAQEAQKKTAEIEGNEDIICNTVDVSAMVRTYGSNVRLVGNALCEYGIKDPYAIIAVLSNVAKESNFKPRREDLTYSTVERVKATFPSKTRELDDALVKKKYVNSPERLANLVYSDQMGNGNEESGDGYKYRGGGFIQLTFKNNYENIGNKIGVDLVTDPDQISDPEVSAKAVAAYIADRFGGAENMRFGSLDEALRAVTKKVNPGGYSRDLPKVQKASTLCFIVGEPAPTVDQPDESQPISNTGGVGGAPVTIPTASSLAEGFADPSGKYPKQDKLNEPDTNRLARGQSINKTIVLEKERRVKTAVQKANGLGTWDQPPIPYNAKYPFNHVFESESGHLLEFDDTPGAERIHTYHRSGTFTEIDHNGTQVNQIVGDGFTVYERNGYVHVSGALHVAVDGAHTVRVQNTLEMEVHGETVINLHGDANLNIAGNANITSNGTANIRANQGVNIDAQRINLNSGIATSLSFISKIEGGGPDYEPLPVNTRGADIDFSYEVDPSVDGQAEVKAWEKKAIEEGLVTKEQLEEQPEKVESETPPDNNIQPVDQVCGIAANQKQFTGQEPLSKYFKLADLTSGYSRKLIPQNGLTEAEIFCNLKALAINVLDPLKARYPGMRINSGYRRPGDAPGSSTKSQHNKGEAVDISFSDVSDWEGMYQRALEVQKLVPYDQMMLEYTSSSRTGWIHISFSQKQQRKHLFTMMNHKRVSPDMKTLVRVRQ